MFCATKEVTLVHKFCLAPNTTTYLILKEKYARIHKVTVTRTTTKNGWLNKFIFLSQNSSSLHWLEAFRGPVSFIYLLCSLRVLSL